MQKSQGLHKFFRVYFTSCFEPQTLFLKPFLFLIYNFDEPPYLHVPVGAQRLLDVSSPSSLRPQLDRLEPLDVSPVEEHEPDDGRLAVDLEGVARQDGALDDQPVGVGRQEAAAAHQLVPAGGHLPVDQDVGRREHDGGERRHDDHLVVGLPVAQVLVLFAWKTKHEICQTASCVSNYFGLGLIATFG